LMLASKSLLPSCRTGEFFEYRPAARVEGARRREVAAARIGLGCIVGCYSA
jgi:hypothetical protein